MIAILDNIRSNHNVGSMFRTADAFGIEKIYLVGITPTPLDKYKRENTALTKVSLGAEQTVAWEHVPTAELVIPELKANGYTILAIEQDEKAITDIKDFADDTDFEKTVLIFGSEVEGVDPALMKLCDYIFEIPMHGKKESLNVAVTFGIATHYLTRQLHG